MSDKPERGDNVRQGGDAEGTHCGVRAGSDGGEERKSRKRDLMNGLLPDALQTLEKPLLEGSETDVTITDAEPLGSYSWIKEEQPTIIVPGSPRIWSNLTLPLTVTPDSGESFIDQNSYRLPDYPMLPLFEAIDALTADGTRKAPKWTSVNVITDRNNLLKLAGWADPGCSTSRSKKDFRIDIQLIGPQTVLLQRWEERTSAWAQGNFGDAFERAASHPAPGCEQATLAGSSRIISYDFAGLKLVVRFDVDACHEPEEKVTTPNASLSVDDLAGALSSLSVSPSPSIKPSKYPGGPTVIRGGLDVPQASLIKVKTRSRANKTGASSSAEYLQLLIGQTPTLYVGIHENGTFGSIRERRLDSHEFTYSAQKVQPGLKKLRKLLEDIRDIAVQRGSSARWSLVCQKGVLKVMERTGGGSLLPGAVLQRFSA